ncbi:hypothetical protein HMPREF0083_02397 [Aneurinibacillus aneurinilyticus ATCC 12856]|jgi:hypothetical protein|uniref:Uncharacterized protein n=1 Tax=Aneurinibacillus aneurinilyticus ATCC 12856 TaxID=649747 RepID=U1YFH1_ANEAE|nr:hypothetical protein HMPREF0083_02397 [Aneurinibacillus aneurinilyticus ATCC 12856]
MSTFNHSEMLILLCELICICSINPVLMMEQNYNEMKIAENVEQAFQSNMH